MVRRLPNERLSLLNTLSVPLRSQPKQGRYYLTIDFRNVLQDAFCAVFGGKNAEKAYRVLKTANQSFHGDQPVLPSKKKGVQKAMNNFTYYVPTRIHFGKGMISHLSELKQSGKRVLLVYGGGSIKRNGIYDRAMALLKENGLSIYELSGVEPNPKIETVRKGVALCKEQAMDMVLAIGGGSAIDCAKAIAIGAKYDGDAWDLVMDPSKITKALPIYSVLTMSATGSEMDRIAVISNMDLKIKKGVRAACMAPTMSILDPTYTYSVPKRQTAAGTADIMSHTLENYFTNVTAADIQARFAEGVLKTVIKHGPVALNKPDDYDARANLMWAATQAINGILSNGSEVKWCVHPMEHELSAFYDITHGEGLAILTPVWMEYVLNEKTIHKFVAYGTNVWGIDPGKEPMKIAKEAIAKTKTFLFEDLGCPKNLREVGIVDDSNFKTMAKKAEPGCQGSFVDLSKANIEEIFRRSL